MRSARAIEVTSDLGVRERHPLGQLGLATPLTERVLTRLGAPRWIWIAGWATTAILAPAVLLTVLSLTGESGRLRGLSDLLISQAVLAYAIGLALFGIGRLMRDARALETDLIRLTQTERTNHPLAGTATVAGPVLLTLAITFVNAAGSWVRYGPVPTLAVEPLLAISLLPIMTFVWTYIQLLLGIDQLGRARLALDLFPQDRSLGLSAVGSLAFDGFVILFAAAIPIFVTTSANLATVVLSLGLVGVSTAMFFLSMWRVHRQMAAAKEAHVAQTRALYADAYAPLRATPTVETLEVQAPALSAAQAIVERAERILEWPVDEAMTASVAIIVIGVVTSLVGRLVLGAAGL